MAVGHDAEVVQAVLHLVGEAGSSDLSCSTRPGSKGLSPATIGSNLAGVSFYGKLFFGWDLAKDDIQVGRQSQVKLSVLQMELERGGLKVSDFHLYYLAVRQQYAAFWCDEEMNCKKRLLSGLVDGPYLQMRRLGNMGHCMACLRIV
ncbi:hypothetical protein NDU88_006015 [Pleurodeles waltl]|uniref:Uncharacterized protein n=1 Tax=Pleurodeles waltl TaxID=8319 RepID=A0AAV7WWX4_PLEWA|nr:hypothetical protein NDU88_006015 [Pleurodeles waltl]